MANCKVAIAGTPRLLVPVYYTLRCCYHKNRFRPVPARATAVAIVGVPRPRAHLPRLLTDESTYFSRNQVDLLSSVVAMDRCAHQAVDSTLGQIKRRRLAQ